MKDVEDKEVLGLQLITLSRRYRRLMDSVFQDFGLTDASTLPLRYLIQLGKGIRQKDLAEILDIEGPTLVRVLDHLVDLELVERMEHPEDRRAKLVVVTPKGRKFHASFATRLKAMRDKIFDSATDDEINATLSLLTRLEKNIDALRH